MSTYPNWIADQNKFKLAGPPDWFQRQLWDFDPSLVIVPSRQGFYYRLAQRRKLQLPDRIAQEALWQHSDTQMLASYSLVPVTTILSTVNWGNPAIIEELRRRAPWRMGGAAKVNADLEAQDRQEVLDKQAKNNAMIDDLAKDSWKFYQLKRGMRSSLVSVKASSNDKAESSAPGIVIPGASKPYRPIIQTGWGNSLGKG